MTAKDVISTRENLPPLKSVDASMPLLEVLPHLLDAPGRLLGVCEDGVTLGVIDEVSLLEGLGRLIAPRDDSSVLVVESAPQDYSASLLARAVEDVDAHLVDLISHPADDGKLHVTLRVRTSDPTQAAMSRCLHFGRAPCLASGPHECVILAEILRRHCECHAVENTPQGGGFPRRGFGFRGFFCKFAIRYEIRF